jgi:hypothetical protein
MLKGRTIEQKRKLAARITDAMVEEAKAAKEAVIITFYRDHARGLRQRRRVAGRQEVASTPCSVCGGLAAPQQDWQHPIYSPVLHGASNLCLSLSISWCSAA